MLHDLTTNGVDVATRRHFTSKDVTCEQRGCFIYRLEGYINFIGQVRGKSDAVYLKLKGAFDEVFAEVRF